MNQNTLLGGCARVAFVALGITACTKAPAPGSPGRIDATSMRRIGTVDERFQSYNIEMVEVVGGRFWKPYGANATSSNNQANAHEPGATPVGMDPNLYQYRPPIDLSNPRLRKLAAALGPAYVRISGTW